jgi:hypothetical protein
VQAPDAAEPRKRLDDAALRPAVVKRQPDAVAAGRLDAAAVPAVQLQAAAVAATLRVPPHHSLALAQRDATAQQAL